MTIPLYDEVNPSRIFPDTKYMKSFTVVLVNDLIGKINGQIDPDFTAVWAAINDLDATKVDGPASAVDNRFATFNGVTGKLIADDGQFVGSTTDVLTGTSTGAMITADALAALWEKGPDVAGAASIVLGEGGFFVITGTGASISQITFATPKNGRRALLYFNGANTIIHSGSNLPCPGNTDLPVATGDVIEVFCHVLGTPTYQVSSWKKALAGLIPGQLASTTDVLTGTDAAKAVTSDALAALWERASDVAGAASLVLGEGGVFIITGSGVSITSITFATVKTGRRALLYFSGANTIVHNGSSLLCPGAVNFDTLAGDMLEVVLRDTGLAILSVFRRAAGNILPSDFASTTEVLTGTNAAKAVTADALAALWEVGSAVTAAATVTLGEGGLFVVNAGGGASISDIDFATPKDGRRATLYATVAFTLVHSATLVLPGGVNYSAVSGDRIELLQRSGDEILVTSIVPAADKPLRRDQGVYTPTWNNIANTSAITAFDTAWFRIGDRVHLFGKVVVDHVAGADALTQVRCTLPVTTNFSAAEQATGTISSGLVSTKEGFGSTQGTNEMAFTWISSTTSAITMYFMASYMVLP